MTQTQARLTAYFFIEVDQLASLFTLKYLRLGQELLLIFHRSRSISPPGMPQIQAKLTSYFYTKFHLLANLTNPFPFITRT